MRARATRAACHVPPERIYPGTGWAIASIMSTAAIPLPRTLLVPTDFSEHGTAALDYAAALAAKLDGRVHLLHVITLPIYGLDITGAATATMIDELTMGAQEELDKLIAARPGTPFGKPLLRIGDARDVIDAMAKELKADLIVLGTHGRRGFSRLVMGSVAEAVVRTAPCSVLTVRAT